MKRKNFSEKQKAFIYARDRATCAFSTKSLWALDYGVMSGWVVDWVDHIIPCSSGGTNDLDNGVCASDFFNSQKGSNAKDNKYFIKEGSVTDYYIELFGEPPSALVEQLRRLKQLEAADWYFNRSIVGLFVGYECRCDKEFKGKEWSRDDAYWFKSAWKRLQLFQKLKGNKSITERSLLKDRQQHGVTELLDLESAASYEDFIDILENIYPLYKENYKALFFYHQLENIRQQTAFIKTLENNTKVNPIVLNTMKGNNLLRMQSFRAATSP
ncbi:MAG: hypothetical protein WBA17_11850 [Saprospiraceae bacterium]